MYSVGKIHYFLMLSVVVYTVTTQLQRDDMIVFLSYCQMLIMPQLLRNFLLTRGNLAYYHLCAASLWACLKNKVNFSGMAVTKTELVYCYIPSPPAGTPYQVVFMMPILGAIVMLIRLTGLNF